MALTADGRPVIAFDSFDARTRGSGLGVIVCQDGDCAGGKYVFKYLAGSLNYVGTEPALRLDPAGIPVVSHHAAAVGSFFLTRCTDPNCSTAVTSTIDLTCPTASALDLDAAVNPVLAVSRCGAPRGLDLVHCNDALCGGGDESTQPLASPTSLASDPPDLNLDSTGRPVVTFADGGDLKLVHCNDANCAGGDESLAIVGQTPLGVSSTLDQSDHPVIAYVDGTDGASRQLRIVHCNDTDCLGGDESVVTIAVAGGGRVGPALPSLVLDAQGRPAVSYMDESNDRLLLLRCNDANCAGGDDSIAVIDALVGLVSRSSIALDTAGNPVITYLRRGSDPLALVNTDLMVAHCRTPDCSPDSDGDGIVDVVDNCFRLANPDQLDTDADGMGNACDQDDDGDGVDDVVDALPLDPTESVDTDADGIGDNVDPDADGDRQSNADELSCGSDPRNAASVSADADGDGIPDCVDLSGDPTTGAPTPALPATGLQDRRLGWWAAFVLATGVLVATIARRRAQPRRG